MAACSGKDRVKPPIYCGSARNSDVYMRHPGFEVVDTKPPSNSDTPCLSVEGSSLMVHIPDGSSPWRPEPVEARKVRRDSLLARAVGVHSDTQIEVLDAMAGWGGDGLELVAIGARVNLVEASPIVHALLVERAMASALQPTSIQCADAWGVIASGLWDVIVLDPMFPERGRKGLAKRPMQILQQLATPDLRTLAEWVEHALQHVRSRVVVKRRRTETVHGKPAWQVGGTTVRFDVYVPTQPGQLRQEV